MASHCFILPECVQMPRPDINAGFEGKMEGIRIIFLKQTALYQIGARNLIAAYFYKNLLL